MNGVVSSGGGSHRSVASWWHGRYGFRMLVEIALCGALLIIYRAIRTINKTDMREAFGNARSVIRLEAWMGLPFEDNLQAWLLDHPTLIKLLNHYYIFFHFPAAIAFLLWLYLRQPRHYVPFRNLMAFVTFVALIIHLLYPLAPPRMMTGFVDTMREFGPNIYPKNAIDGAANQIAAMPSLHFGWAMIEAIAVITILKSRWRWLIVLHPFLMAMSIIATGNHWWIDAAAAAVIIVGAVAAYRMLKLWAGDRRWSWTAMRFKTDEGLVRLEELANSAAQSGQASDEGNTLERVD
jgi:PAP2 superfamily